MKRELIGIRRKVQGKGISVSIRTMQLEAAVALEAGHDVIAARADVEHDGLLCLWRGYVSLLYQNNYLTTAIVSDLPEDQALQS